MNEWNDTRNSQLLSIQEEIRDLIHDDHDYPMLPCQGLQFRGTIHETLLLRWIELSGIPGFPVSSTVEMADAVHHNQSNWLFSVIVEETIDSTTDSCDDGLNHGRK